MCAYLARLGERLAFLCILFEPLAIYICFKNKISFKKRVKPGCEGSIVAVPGICFLSVSNPTVPFTVINWGVAADTWL